MGRGRKGGRGEGVGGFEDQYGDAGRSQDRQEHSGFAGRGGTGAGRGGGDAGCHRSMCLECVTLHIKGLKSTSMSMAMCLMTLLMQCRIVVRLTLKLHAGDVHARSDE